VFPAKQGPFSSLRLAGGAEIAAFSSARKVAIVIGGGKVLSLVGLESFEAPSLVTGLTLDADVQSVAIAGDLVAVAKQHPTNKALPGNVEFFRLSGIGAKATLTSLGSVSVGSVPDSLAFNEAGTKLLVANEGEAIDSNTTDAVGNLSIVDTSGFGAATTSAVGFGVTTVGFDVYASQKAKLENLGIRLNSGSTGASVMQNLEPESIAIVDDKAYVTLQENGAVLEVNLTTGAIIDIWSLGVKDWQRGTPSGKDFTFTVNYPGTAPAGVIGGGLSGLFYAGQELGQETYYAISDRGPQPANIGDRPNDNPSDANKGQKIFDDPSFAPTVYKLVKDATTGVYSVASSGTLKVPDGSGNFRAATGIGQISAKDDKAFRLKTAGNGITGDPSRYNQYEQVGWDAFGIDSESINVFTKTGLNNGKAVIAVSDEYGPQISIFDAATGNLIKRFVPSTRDFSLDTYLSGRGDVAAFTAKTLPAVYADRNANRGFEGMAFNSDDGLLYAFMQSPIRPTGFKNQEFIRILAIDPGTGTAVAEYLSLLPVEAGQDKIGDAVYDASRKTFLIIERDSEATLISNKSITEINLVGATNTLDYTLGQNGKSWTAAIGLAQPELSTTTSIADLLASRSIRLANRTELLNIPSVGGNPLFDKPEGLALGPNGKLVVAYDNDFLAVTGRPNNALTEITFTSTPVDTSDRSEAGGVLGVKNLYGLPMADGVDAFKVNGKTFTIFAGEGDDREGAVTGNISINDATRVSSTTYANKAALQTALGDRLKLVNTEGDYNKDNTLDQAYAFGSRGFRIYDEAQNLIFDSGNQLDVIARTLGL
jgi:DNA-binding beta-propeller fold protein YncE